MLHALVNNAGRAPRVRTDLLTATEESFEEVLRTNLQGPYFLTQAVARLLAQQPAAGEGWRRAIVFVTSVSAEMASPHRGEYRVSKAGLSMAAKLFAVRLAPDGIPVYEVRPGIIATDMTAGVKEDLRQTNRRRAGAGREVGSARRRRAALWRRFCAEILRTRQARSSMWTVVSLFPGCEVDGKTIEVGELSAKLNNAVSSRSFVFRIPPQSVESSMRSLKAVSGRSK